MTTIVAIYDGLERLVHWLSCARCKHGTCYRAALRKPITLPRMHSGECLYRRETKPSRFHRHLREQCVRCGRWRNAGAKGG